MHIEICACASPLVFIFMFGQSLGANDLLCGQSNELVEVKLDVLPPVASVFAVDLGRIARTA